MDLMGTNSGALARKDEVLAAFAKHKDEVTAGAKVADVR